MISSLVFFAILPFSVSWAGNWCGQRLFYARPFARLGVCIVLAGLALVLVHLNGLANGKMFAGRAVGSPDRYAEWASGFSLVGFEICTTFAVGIALGWRSWKPWVRRILLGLGAMCVVAIFVLGAAGQSGEL